MGAQSCDARPLPSALPPLARYGGVRLVRPNELAMRSDLKHASSEVLTQAPEINIFAAMLKWQCSAEAKQTSDECVLWPFSIAFISERREHCRDQRPAWRLWHYFFREVGMYPLPIVFLEKLRSL